MCCILSCTSEEINLNNIKLSDIFKCPIGWSDHTIGNKDELAVAMGAKIIEKHFTYRKEDQSFRPSYQQILRYDELVKKIKCRNCFGSYERKIRKSEKALNISEGHMLLKI